MSSQERIGGRASKEHTEKMRKLSDFCYAPRYVKFFTAFFKDEDGDLLNPYEEVEQHISEWINQAHSKNIGYEMLQVQPTIAPEELVVMVLYRKYQLY